MSSNQEDIELIERFFRQELSEEELFSFENRVKQDPAFSKEVIAMRDLYYGVKWAARKDLKAELKEIEKEALSEGTESYNPKIKKWWKWLIGSVIIVIVAVIAFKYLVGHDINAFKSDKGTRDSISDPQSTTPFGATTLIKDPSDSAYDNIEADIKLQVKDPSTFKIEKIGSEGDLYNYKIWADGDSHYVSSTNPELSSELMKKKAENVKRDPIDGLDYQDDKVLGLDTTTSVVKEKRRLFQRRKKK